MARLLVALILLASAACTSGPPAPDDDAYIQDLEQFRTSREAALRDDPDAIPEAKRNLLLPLRYYPPDPKYRREPSGACSLSAPSSSDSTASR
jgi:hypothetical protein